MFVQRLVLFALSLMFMFGLGSPLANASATESFLRPRPPAPPAPPRPGPVQQGQFVVGCGRGQTAAVDPIVMPGMAGMSHMHQFFGNRSTDEFSTFDSLMASQSSTCRMRGDFSAYWVPALYNGDTMIQPRGMRAVYRRSTDAAVTLPPDGLMLIAGSAKATSEQDINIVSWQCSTRGSTASTTPPACTRGELVAKIAFPECWDGVSVDSADHKSHVQYAVDGACAAGTIAIPQLTIEVSYPRQSDTSQLTLASGSILTMHADFFNAWSRNAFQRQLDQRLNR